MINIKAIRGPVFCFKLPPKKAGNKDKNAVPSKEEPYSGQDLARHKQELNKT